MKVKIIGYWKNKKKAKGVYKVIYVRNDVSDEKIYIEVVRAKSRTGALKVFYDSKYNREHYLVQKVENLMVQYE